MIALGVIAAVVGTVWGLVLALRGSLLGGCAVYLVLASCFGVLFLEFDVAGVTLSFDRLFLAYLVGAFLLQWRLGNVDWKALRHVDFLLLAWFGVIALSMFSHEWRADRPGQVPIPQHFLNGYAIPLALYVVARQCRLDARSTTILFGVLSVFGIYLAVIGVLETLHCYGLVFPHYIADPAVGLHFGRARGPMVHSVSYGLYLITCLVALGLWSRDWQTTARSCLFVLVPLLLAAIFMTKTRSVWLGAATALLTVLMIVLRGRVRLAVLGGALAAGVLVGAAKSDALIGFQREGSVDDTRKSTSMRGSFAYVSWLMFQDRPWLGCGFGQFAHAKQPYLSDRNTRLDLDAIRPYVHHNTFLAVLTETGLIGLLLMLAVLGGWGYDGWRLATSGRAPPWARRMGLLLLATLGAAAWQMMWHEITFTSLDQAILFTTAGVGVGLRAAGWTESAPWRTPGERFVPASIPWRNAPC